MMDSEVKANEQLGSFSVSELSIGSKAEKQGFNTSEAQCFIPDQTLLEKPKQEKLVKGKFRKSIQNNSIHCPDKPIGEKSAEEKSMQDKPIRKNQCRLNKKKPKLSSLPIKLVPLKLLVTVRKWFEAQGVLRTT